MKKHEELGAFFEQRLAGYLDLLHQMVDINSFTANPQGVNQLGELTAARFAILGFDVEKVQSANPRYGQHLYLTRHGTGPHTLALISHLDTVFAPEEEIQNDFHWRVEGDRVFGPGTVDIKGGTVMILMTLEALQRHFPEIFESTTWIVALDATEETLSIDFDHHLLERLAEAPAPLACLVFEGGTPANGKYPYVTARKGRASFKVQVEGRSAHAGNRHHQGANAIVQMGHTVQRIAALTNYDQQITFNVGVVRGGVVVNRVPHFAEAEVEMRAFSPQIFEQGVADMLALNGQAQVVSQDGYPCKVEIRLTDRSVPWPRNPQTDRLFDLWRAVGAGLGMPVIPEERGGLSDGNLLWDHYPTLDGLGPEGNNAHCSERADDGSKEQEYVLISSFVPKAVLNTLAIHNLIAG